MTRAFALRLVPLKNLRAHPVRAAIILILALAQAACVFGGFVALDGMRAELSLAQRRLGADLVVYPTSCLNKVDKKSVTMLGTPALCDQPRSALSRMGANEDIAAVSYQLTIADQTHGDDPLWVVGYDPATDFVISPWIAEGEGVSPQVGTVAVGSAVPLTDAGDVTIFGRQWPVGAHLEATGTSLDAAVFVSMDTLSQVIAASTQAGVDTYASLNPAEDYTVALVRVANPADVQAVTEWINLYVRKVSAVRSDLTVATTASDIRAHRTVVLGVLGAAWLVLLAALMLAQLTLMNERRHEIYVWRSIGASRRVIARVLTAESLLVHVVGALAGVLVGACVLQGKYLFTIDMSEYIENFVYDDSYNPCVSYVPADIYRKIDNQLKSAVLQAEKDEEEARQKAAAERAAAEAAPRAAAARPEETEDTASQSAAGQELKEQLDETELEKIATTEKNEALIFDMMEYYAQKSRCYYKRSDFVNFHTAVKCSDLVILSGLSGTGKSSLVNIYAKALGLNASADLEDSQMLMVPVRPSWSDDADLLGYVDLAHMVYHAADSGFVDFLVRAQREENKNKLFLVCFEEMNLARVEHYFSQFLSILERPAGQRELQLYDKQYMGKLYNAADYPFQIEIGNNVKFIGTVNIDETTHHFSDKVLDRANVIELEVLNYATEWQEKTFAAVGKTQIWSTQDYEKLIVKEQIPDAREVRSLLWEVHCALQSLSPKYGAGPRVVKNVLKYLSNLPKEEALDFDRALDLQLVQRVLTKLRGVESVVGLSIEY